MVLHATTERVSINTSDRANERIWRDMEKRLRECAERLDRIDVRLRELDREWDIERTLEANAAVASLIGLTMGATINRNWFILPGVVAAFLLLHAFQGWCPPLPIFRRLGVRTQSEIEAERTALKAMRGDFEGLERIPPDGGSHLMEVQRVLRVVRTRS